MLKNDALLSCLRVYLLLLHAVSAFLPSWLNDSEILIISNVEPQLIATPQTKTLQHEHLHLLIF